MTASTIRQLLADVLADSTAFEELSDCDTRTYAEEMASALLASPELAAIIDLAAWWDGFSPTSGPKPVLTVDQRALLADWRANR